MAKIRELDPLVAQRIAAGEVIERPLSVVRELLDNAIDSEANEISLYISQGGLDSISVVDNGKGIIKDDLPLTIKRHATSKIKSLDDLYHLSSLGFRGEALYAISSVSDFSISSSNATFSIDNGRNEKLIDKGVEQGTIVTVKDLFKEIPARRAFLKRPSSEATLVKNIFIQKAIAFPEITFKYFQDGNLKLELPKTDTLFERISSLINAEKKHSAKDFIEIDASYADYSIKIITGNNSVYRSDRSGIKVYINNRPVEEYSLLQAVTYGYGELLPGGSFPITYLFIYNNPELVDFNIHPAKKEVKLRNKSEIHHSIVTMIKNNVERAIPSITPEVFEKELFTPTTPKSNGNTHFNERRPSFTPSNNAQSFSKITNTEERPKDNSWLEKAKDLFKEPNTKSFVKEEIVKDEIKYIGQAFKLFLIAEKDSNLYLIDQHAAHERILFDDLKSLTGIQKLLVPIEIEVERDVDDFLSNHSDIYTQYGIMLSKISDLLWEISALPALAKPVEKTIAEFIQTRTGDENLLEMEIYAIMACRAAIKAGDEVDVFTAKALIERVFELEEPVCPHGRTFLIKLSEDDLRQMVGRTK